MTKPIILCELLLLLLLSSCATYSTFYSKTHRTLNHKETAKVYRLDLSHQNLKQTPEVVSTLANLKTLNLSNNHELDLDAAFLRVKYPENLEVLLLDSLSLRELPISIKRFTKLKQLSLVNNPNLNLEETFNLIVDLPIEFLNLKGNNIHKLPKSVTKLKALKDLNLSYNALTDSKSYTYLGTLPKLYSLWLDHNKLNQLPTTIGSLYQIHYLYIDNNALEIVPSDLEQMENLWVIHAGFNRFKALPEVFIKMKSLLMVHINNNNITHFSTKFRTEKYSLRGLLLDNNPITANEQKRLKKVFKGFFLLSFQQKKY